MTHLKLPDVQILIDANAIADCYTHESVSVLSLDNDLKGNAATWAWPVIACAHGTKEFIKGTSADLAVSQVDVNILNRRLAPCHLRDND